MSNGLVELSGSILDILKFPFHVSFSISSLVTPLNSGPEHGQKVVLDFLASFMTC